MFDIASLSALEAAAAQHRKVLDAASALQRLQDEVLSATSLARRHLDEIEKARAVLEPDYLQQARDMVGMNYMRDIRRNARLLGLGDHVSILRDQMLGHEHALWHDPVRQLQEQLGLFDITQRPWFFRDGLDLRWLVTGPKKYSDLWVEHAHYIEQYLLASLRPTDPGPRWRPPDKQKTVTVAALQRVVMRTLRALRARVQALHTNLLRHFIFGTRFTASIEPAHGCV